ncbi:MAG TPA: ATP-binding cassette domain-containing protein, partial [Caulobacteraceae bacterium]
MTESAAQPLLQVSNLAKRYPSGGGVDDVSLSVAPGAITGFIGVNGAGKSTTLRCVLGLVRPDAGEVRLFGRPADGAGRRRVGFLPEERGLFPRDRARDVIAFHARLKGMGRKAALASADRLLERIGLGGGVGGGRQSARIETLSKGNAQRVQILCALAHGPDLLILDEPLSGLDPIAQSEVLSLFAEFRAGGGAILFSTHSMAAAETLCDAVVVLAGGRTVFEGPVAEASGRAPHGAVVVTA